MKLSSSVFSAFCLIIELIGIVLFLRGFFPVPIKSSLSSKSKLSDLPAEPVVGSSPNSTKVPPPLFNRVVVVLIDALRDDFVFGPNGKRFMPYTRNLVESGSSHSFIAKARPPTVTMPRIKKRIRCWLLSDPYYDKAATLMAEYDENDIEFLGHLQNGDNLHWLFHYDL
ncbi:GPI ethanolamine phosphate transferase 2 isoform X1 [Tachysurus ichikawai]